MKLKKYIVAGLIGIVSLGSCTYLDKEPDTEIDIDMVFENKTKVILKNAALIALGNLWKTLLLLVIFLQITPCSPVQL